MENSKLNLALVNHILDETIPQQKPSLVGHTPGWNIFLAAYENFHDCHVPKHNAPFHVLEVIDESPKLFHQRILGDHKIEGCLNGDEVSIYPAHADYYFDSSDGDQGEGVSFTLVGIDPTFVEDLLRERFGYKKLELKPQFLVTDTQKIRTLVNLIKQEMINGLPEGSLFLENLRDNLIICLLTKSGVSREHLDRKNISSLGCNRVQLIKELLGKDLQKNISLEYLEKYLGISKFHISRSFKQAEGISISAYRKQARIEKAKELLTNNVPSITEVAQKCGFSDASHLNRYFKASTGINPSQFREQFQKRIDIY
jgi:AraC-like DNA-binding protein